MINGLICIASVISRDSACVQVNIWNVIYLHCWEKYEDMIDRCSYTHNLSSCEIKAVGRLEWYWGELTKHSSLLFHLGQHQGRKQRVKKHLTFSGDSYRILCIWNGTKSTGKMKLKPCQHSSRWRFSFSFFWYWELFATEIEIITNI